MVSLTSLLLKTWEYISIINPFAEKNYFCNNIKKCYRKLLNHTPHLSMFWLNLVAVTFWKNLVNSTSEKRKKSWRLTMENIYELANLVHPYISKKGFSTNLRPLGSIFYDKSGLALPGILDYIWKVIYLCGIQPDERRYPGRENSPPRWNRSIFTDNMDTVFKRIF